MNFNQIATPDLNPFCQAFVMVEKCLLDSKNEESSTKSLKYSN